MKRSDHIEKIERAWTALVEELVQTGAFTSRANKNGFPGTILHNSDAAKKVTFELNSDGPVVIAKLTANSFMPISIPITEKNLEKGIDVICSRAMELLSI